MESCHCVQVRGESFALACLKLLDEVIHRLLDEQLRGVVALCGALLVGGIAAIAERRIFPVRCGVAAAGCAVAGVGCCGCCNGEWHVVLLRSPVGPICVQKQEHPNPIFFVERPRFMALRNGRRREGSVKTARSPARSSKRSGEP